MRRHARRRSTTVSCPYGNVLSARILSSTAQEIAIDEPWRGLPPRIGELIRPHVAGAQRRDHRGDPRARARLPPAAARAASAPGSGPGWRRRWRQFVDLIADPDLDRSASDAVYRGLGRGEHRERRSLDALLAAYRLGARVAWRRVSAIAIEARRRPAARSALLAEAVFAYIDELSALSADGYAEAQSAAAGERERLRRRLAALLLEPDPDEAAIRAAAADADWELPGAGRGPRLGGRRPPAARAAAGGHAGRRRRRTPRSGLALLADPEAPGPARGARARAAGPTAVLGPAVELLAARRSADRARELRRLIDAGLVAAAGLRARRRPPRRRWSPTATSARSPSSPRSGCAPLAARRRRRARGSPTTLRAWLDHQGEVVAGRRRAPRAPADRPLPSRAAARAASATALDDPAARFELALALRSPVSAAERREPSDKRPKARADERHSHLQRRHHGRRERRAARAGDRAADEGLLDGDRDGDELHRQLGQPRRRPRAGDQGVAGAGHPGGARPRAAVRRADQGALRRRPGLARLRRRAGLPAAAGRAGRHRARDQGRDRGRVRARSSTTAGSSRRPTASTRSPRTW